MHPSIFNYPRISHSQRGHNLSPEIPYRNIGVHSSFLAQSSYSGGKEWRTTP